MAWNCSECGTGNGPGAVQCRVCQAPAPSPRTGGDPPDQPFRAAYRPPRRQPPPVYAPEAYEPEPAYRSARDRAPGTVAAPTPPARRRPHPASPLVVTVAVALTVGVSAAAYATLRQDPAPVPVTAPTTAPVASTDSPFTEPPSTETEAVTEPAPDPVTDSPTPDTTQVGMVTLEVPAQQDGRGGAVATVFDAYFTAVNNRDWDAVGDVLDPSGSVDPTSTKQMNALAAGLATTTDSDVYLTAVGDGTAPGTVAADVTFISNQDPGYGPRGRASETCSRWRLTYQLSTDGYGGYRIVRGKGSSEPC